MRILFTLIGNSRRSNYLNGETIRIGNAGASGTDTSTILVAEYLATKGHEVYVTTDSLESQIVEDLNRKGIVYQNNSKIKKVIYTDINLTGVENRTFDFLINSLWFQDYDDLKIKVTKGIIYWCHMQWIYGISNLLSYGKKMNVPIGFVNISNWERNQNINTIKSTQLTYEKVILDLIPNPIILDIVDEVRKLKIQKKKNKFIFHASWPRGGDVALDYLKKSKIEGWELHAFDYLMVIHDHKEPNFFKHQGVDKFTLFKHLAESEYFLYPLYTPYKDVHKDTFSCVVAEAIALGCKPITYPLGALPEYFSDFCQWIKLPQDVNLDEIQSEALTKDEKGLFKNNDFILDVLNNPIDNLDEMKGYEYIKDNFSIDKIGSMWSNYLDRF